MSLCINEKPIKTMEYQSAIWNLISCSKIGQGSVIKPTTYPPTIWDTDGMQVGEPVFKDKHCTTKLAFSFFLKKKRQNKNHQSWFYKCIWGQTNMTESQMWV